MTKDRWQIAEEVSALVHGAHFSRSDALAILGVTPKALEHMLDPKFGRVQLDGRFVNPGTGRRRMFTGADLLHLETARVISGLGFPHRLSHQVAKQVVTRAKLAALSAADPAPYAMALWPHPTGEEWAFVPVIDGNPTGPLPPSFMLVDVDRIITEMFAKMQALLRDEPIPSFEPEFPPQGNEEMTAPAGAPLSAERPRDPAGKPARRARRRGGRSPRSTYRKTQKPSPP